MTRYVIVGNGVAGMSAVEAIREHDPKAEILVVGDEAHEFYSRPGLAYLLSGEIHEDSLFPLNREDLGKLRFKRLQAVARRIDLAQHKLSLQDGSRLTFDRLLVATGASAVFPPVAGINLPGVVKLDNLDDARRILEQGRKARSVVIVGGGITALELVEGLLARGVKVHYFLRGERYWSSVLSENESRIVEKRLKDHGVEIHYRTELAEILAENQRVSAVLTQENQLIRCDLVGIAVGVRPRLELAEVSGLKTERGILANEYLQTSASDIFAAGDAAQVFSPITGQYSLESLWRPAREQGRAAGLNMAGIATTYQKKTALNITRLAGQTVMVLGMLGGARDTAPGWVDRGESETWRQSSGSAAVEVDFDSTHLRILVGREAIMGALVMGSQSLSTPLQGLITGRVDISPVRAKLLSPAALRGDLLSGLWDQWRRDHAAQPA